MRLSIERIGPLSQQDRLDLAKIWPHQTPEQWQAAGALFAARFNARLLAAVKVEWTGDRGVMRDLCVREVTRRRGVGRYLLEEVQRQLPTVRHWRVEGASGDTTMQAFMLACGFRAEGDGWTRDPAAPAA
ncbi:aspartate 1-decarboxylase autocleavage activator PanM [Nissabacter sp. SGAir0207]|uniref:aspartate 1-decarboxylase autocleavage activator PanM n=1 Tax=Nissabacter sp. SGAir0207 TaxID=2126321 RepID=UPI0010CCCFC6|nr:aspartate 1-decarboxylase autocleavage activator PanM [Nissabacter sp. SGAir0207]QCR37945.1 aspartate 1-decarboxylase autocleavage activator PanM [Nissabacter sp. SGAir0207]